MTEKESAIKVKEFVEKLLAGGGINPLPADFVEYGYQAGWLEAQDVAEQERPLLRKHAARVIHNFLRMEIEEADEIDGSPAYIMQDLFDCNVCAGHIIQVYVKGIMETRITAEDRQVFGTEECVTPKEAEDVIRRVFDKTLRTPKQMENGASLREVRKISGEEALKLYRSTKNALLVDVRPQREYEEGHWKGAINLPLLSLMKNPYGVGVQRDRRILLYCNEGEQSAAAARCLLEAGYTNVVCFARKKTGY